MRRYLIVPSDFSPDNIPQDKLEELHINGPNEHNADIVIMENGVVKRPRLPYRRTLAQRLGAELVPVESEIVTEKGVERKVWGEGEEEKDLKKGMPFLPQFVMQECDWENGLKSSEIVDILDSLGWFDRIADFDVEENLKSCLSHYEEEGFLTYNDADGTWHYGPRRLEDHKDLGKEGYDIEEGPYPVIRLVRDVVSSERRPRKDTVLRKVYNDWNATSSRGAAEYWLGKTRELGYVREPEENLFEPHRAIQRAGAPPSR